MTTTDIESIANRQDLQVFSESAMASEAKDKLLRTLLEEVLM